MQRGFVKKINPKAAVPLHCGLFDGIDMNDFKYGSKVIPEIYKEIRLLGEENNEGY